MSKRQFRVLYREFLFRVVDLEILAPEGDITKLLGQFAALLLFLSLWSTPAVMGMASASPVPEIGLIGAWIAEHFLISTTMLVVGLFAVMSWDSMFPDRRDVLVLSPLPVRAPVLFAAKVAAVASGLGLTVAALNAFTGLAAPFAFAAAPATPPPRYDAAIAPVAVGDMRSVLEGDFVRAGMARGGVCPTNPGCGFTIGIVKHGERQIFAYGAAKRDSLYGIGSITKTFTGLLLARMVAEHRVTLDEPVRELLPSGVAVKPAGPEITLLDLATHHSGLPTMPDNLRVEDMAEAVAHYNDADLYAYFARRGVGKPARAHFHYSNLNFALMAEALARRAGSNYANLLKEEITQPLGMSDTRITLEPEQRQRLIQSYDARGRAVAALSLGALAGAGAMRSTAGDLLTYLEAQLHPEKLSANLDTLQAAIVESHELRADAGASLRIALAWVFDADKGIYWHNGAVAGYTSYAFFHPKGDYAGVVLFNAASPAGFTGLLGEHLVQRFAGKPAVSLANSVVPGKGGVLAAARSLAVYWFTIVASGVFVLCCVLSVQGLAQLLPRQIFLRLSSFLQMAFFVLLLTVYFLQPGFADLQTLAEEQQTLGWLPSYWFFGLFQQWNGPLRPELAFLPHRAWIGLGAAVCGAAAAYLVCYFRTLRKIAEQPDILPDSRRFHWLPRFGGAFETAVGQFSVRSLLRSRQHRVLLSFYLGAALGLALFIAQGPVLHEERPEDTWYQVNGPLLVASALMVCAAVIGTRMVFAMPLEPRANWMFRVMPLPAMPRCLPAIRRSLYALAIGPMWAAFALFFLWFWPWRIAAEHLAILGLLGVIAGELSIHGFCKIPFTCSYQPGKSHFNMAGVIFGILMFLLFRAAALERSAFDSARLFAIAAGALAVIAILLKRRTEARANSEDAALQFDDPPEPAVLSLGLYRDGVLPMEPPAAP
jgi:CubicO group peptidase (beta-lactamase class C family)